MKEIKKIQKGQGVVLREWLGFGIDFKNTFLKEASPIKIIYTKHSYHGWKEGPIYKSYWIIVGDNYWSRLW